MKLCFTPTAWDDYLWFQERDRKLLSRWAGRWALPTPFQPRHLAIACIAKCCALHPLPYQMCYTISRTY